ncbi:DUF6332 family protein [Streptomyces genisteinicus]|uniref:Uncharacterized protein n=1 Tax=Streptomyces genisteinicus TaxID=2768068 RepID=A0A7H0HTV2_9ACTN|nr:DUF6332 family protein [Streptomyces genisteinicus]QNP63968.1 hypothetical protein IAG43_14205 [Streptomyces genisteinicus]
MAAERDARTVEIGYALVTGVFLGAVAGLALASPVLVLGLRGTAMTAVLGTAAVGAVGVSGAWVVRVLWRFDRGRRRPE